MTDHQKIHPVDVEAPAVVAGSPTAPLMPRDSSRSDKSDPAHQPQGIPPPYRRTIPVNHSKPPKRRGFCCRCFCCTICTLLVLILAIAATVGILFLIFRPKIPKYSVDRLSIANFTVDTNSTVNAQFDVTVTTRNPNKRIGIYYEDGSHLSVLYDDTVLVKGAFPSFYQGHHNTTVVDVIMTGQTQMGSSLITSLQAQQQTGTIPLVFKGDVPVRVKFGALKLWKIRFRVTCDLVVNSLTANNKISIRSSKCRFRLKKLF
ncbi:hypothetical protein QJS04_geneDACA019230 [Acorus gramineus]|uniref:Late embryogenesis abundant protein LEA-2 subgroup domain-containing protein n=1 Tax=Acorus gramineus TaxID=55184 RepID=A0AAV8ZX40_ACOGR|nr:hypothetical protein QJS04_geneDACA019230 [Acorus gramineus]